MRFSFSFICITKEIITMINKKLVSDIYSYHNGYAIVCLLKLVIMN